VTTRWEDTPFVKLYVPPAFGPWRERTVMARGLFAELMKVVDRAGFLPVGRDEAASVALAVNGPVDYCRQYLEELVTDGCLVLCKLADGSRALLIRNFVEAQTAKAGDRVRQAESRRRARDRALRAAENTTSRQLNLLPRDSSSREVAEVSRSDQIRREEIKEPPSSSSTTPATPPPADAEPLPDGAPGTPGWAETRRKLGMRG
jgi:hypothetical protein